MTETRRVEEPASGEQRSHTKVKACGVDVGFGFPCRREQGHEGFHTWNPKLLLGEEPVPMPDPAALTDEKDVQP